ncbi:1-acyl-sn-glycerol-3-phosphate acyltransferase [Nocardioides marmoribigeumensis]|uniref:1-acyl-sn-glycerol-3-phosphate acyltransferase n=1 Tax=Nocardioides marmoribigeumensis TaxID=433649 RepID=A0ABU2BR47_9ACTN|nr:1-acyl-sn-glycerol-3-phosphate acyltransferase [Nocardioides marmoribigeumensis]MDR7361092.1 1-acyl-sn-glycerol-3-phosphate acyltransferase [Nocardioides marmoribigeumensis]
MTERYVPTWSPRWWVRGARRAVTGSLVVGLTVLLLGFVPVALLAAAALSPFVPGQWRPLRLLWIAVVQAVLESLMLVALFGLWIASGLGWKLHGPRFERAHYVLARWYLVVFFRECRRVLRLKISTEGPTPDARPGDPLLVCCRHAGPGDSFVLMYALLHWYDREPRVVLKETLAWDPMVDTLLNRVPSRFISAGDADVEQAIAGLAADLDEDDAFVIFPEGGNFTPRRRHTRIARLREKGLHGMAERAEGMQHVLAPQPGGLLAALDAAPDADVMLVAHTGLEHLVTVRDVWRELPMDKEILMRWWRVPRAEVPTDRDERIDWLFSWWEDIDRWVDENRPRDLEPLRLRVRRRSTR